MTWKTSLWRWIGWVFDSYLWDAKFGELGVEVVIRPWWPDDD